MFKFLSTWLGASYQSVTEELKPETLTAMSNELSEVNEKLQAAIQVETSLKEQLSGLKSQVSTLEGQLAQVTSEKETLATDLQSANQKAANLQVLIDDIQSKAKDGGNSDMTSQMSTFEKPTETAALAVFSELPK